MQAAARLDAGLASIAERCRVLARDHWGRRPVVLGRAADVLGGTQDILDGLVSLGRRGQLPRLYADGKSVAPAAGDACSTADPSIEAYVERLARAHGANEITCIAKDLEISNERIWFPCARFLTALYAAVGFPAGNASLALFAGKYGRTPFGCHKDVDDVITYVIAGRKRFLVWPYEVVANHLRLPADVRHHSVTLEKFDYSVLRESAVVLEGEPGDLLYWPWDHWHVAESDGQLTASLSLGIEPFAPQRTRAGEPVASDDPTSHDAAAEQALFRRTRFGFRTPLPQAGGATFRDDDWLAPPLPDLIAWHDQAGGLVVSVNGHGFSLDTRPGLTAVFSELDRGERLQVKTLRERYCADDMLDREELDQVLDCLLRFRAFAHEPAADAASTELFERSDWHPVHLADDGRAIDFAHLTEDQHRILDGFTAPGRRAPLDRVLRLYDEHRPAGARPRYLFTAGYCGSTLISRCIEAIEHCWTINEPRVLDDWALHHGALRADERGSWRRVLDVLAVLLFRSNHPEGKVVVKGGEGATGIMEELLETGPRPTGLFLYSSLPVFLANTLKTAARRAEFRRVVRSGQRALVAHRLGLPGVDPGALTDAQAIAHVWRTDLELYEHLRRRSEGTLRALEFDGFLEAPAHGIRALADHLDLALAPGREHAIAGGELFRTHAKRHATEPSFDKHARRAAVAAQRTRYQPEIAAALVWSRELWGGDAPARLPGDVLGAPALVPPGRGEEAHHA